MKLPGYDPILPEQSLPHVLKLKQVSFLQDRANELRKNKQHFLSLAAKRHARKVMYGSLGLADFVVRLVVSDFHLPNEEAKCFWRKKFEKTSSILLFACKLALVASFKVKYSIPF